MSEADLYIIGGGGVLYNNGETPDERSPHFAKITAYLDHAIANGIPYGFSSCGFQFKCGFTVQEKVASLKLWTPYLQGCSFATFRSESCLRYFHEVSGRKDGAVFPDLGYMMQVQATPKNQITYIPAVAVNLSNPLLLQMTDLFGSQGYEIVCLRMGAMVDDEQHLRAVREIRPEWRVADREDIFGCAKIIAESRLVISGRYHGCVFAKANGVPFYRPRSAPYKNQAENWNQQLDDAIGHTAVIGNFLRSIPDNGTGTPPLTSQPKPVNSGNE